jgi:hypothetical protein
MLLNWSPAGAGKVTVTLTLNGGVALVAPELWQLVRSNGHASYVLLPLQGSGAAHAVWEVSPDPATGQTHLLLNYQAMDPVHPQLNYDSEVKVQDATGVRLPARSGQNPETTHRHLGPTPAHWDSVQEAISIW